MKIIKEYLPLLTICLLYFGFCNLYYYYNEFKIDIYDYINPQEILLSFLPTIVIITSFIYSYLIQTIISKKQEIKDEVKNDNEATKEIPKKKWINLKSPTFWIFIFWMILEAVNYFLISKYHIKRYDLKEYQIFCSFILMICIYVYIKRNKDRNFITDNALFISIIMVMYIGNQFQLYRQPDALKIKDGISEKKISFKYSNKVITTSTNLIFIGQTQSYIFLYNRKDSSALIFKTANIDSLSIK